jgi:hypothetical protein
MENELVEAQKLLEKTAALLENAGWPGYAMEIADMANAVARLPYRGRRTQRADAAIEAAKS